MTSSDQRSPMASSVAATGHGERSGPGLGPGPPTQARLDAAAAFARAGFFLVTCIMKVSPVSSIRPDFEAAVKEAT